MTLFDTDETSQDRSNPQPNGHDAVNGTRMAHNTVSTSYTPTGNNPKSTRVVFKNNVILYYDDQNRIIKVDGFIPSLANYPVTIQAIYGYDVYVDILGLAAPGAI